MVTEPESMEELIYFTNRTIGDGKVRAWVYRGDCPSCGKAKMGKPQGKDGSVKIRAKEYVCPSCGHTVEKKAYEESLMLEAVYACPSCGKEGDASVPYKRKKIDGVDTVRMHCQHCNANIDITKKMKAKKQH